MQPDLTIVVPCFNEEETLPTSASLLSAKLRQLTADGLIGSQSRLLFVDDGSTDRTWQIVESLNETDNACMGLKLSRNVGHQNALLAGLEHVTTAICISIDADLQDDIDAIDQMVQCYHKGFQVVYGVRKNRSSDTTFKRQTARVFYRLMATLGAESIDNHADFRLLSLPALKALLSMREVNIYLRGMVPLVGFPSTSVYYDRSPRLAGESKYPFRKMLGLAVKGVTSFSVAPLRFIATLGLMISVLSAALSAWVIINKIFGHPVQGWASTELVTFFMGGVQMLALGVVGEYVGCIYLEVKRRPRYFVEKTTADNSTRH